MQPKALGSRSQETGRRLPAFAVCCVGLSMCLMVVSSVGKGLLDLPPIALLAHAGSITSSSSGVGLAKKRGPDTFLSRLFTRHNDLRKIENARAREMRKTMLGIKDRSLAVIERNMTTFREAGEYIDSAAALGRAQQTVADIDALVAQQADWATGNVLSMRKEAWTQGVADIEFASGKLPLDIQSKMSGSFGQVFPEAAFSAIEHPVLGVGPKNMFNGVRAGTTQNMRNLLTTAVISGESVQETGRKISQALDMSVAAGERIARTNVNAAYNEAQKAVYDANSDIIIGYQWEATLDDRTTLICFDLHGNFWPLGSKTPGPPAHWNCRSILLPVFKDPAIQSLVAETPRRARYYDKDGVPSTRLVPGDTTPTSWLRDQPKDIQRNVLGTKLKTDLFRRKMIGIDDIVDPSLRVLSDNEVLRRAAAKHPGNDYIDGLLKKRAIGKVPSEASVIKSDAALARKQPWRAPEKMEDVAEAAAKAKPPSYAKWRSSLSEPEEKAMSDWLKFGSRDMRKALQGKSVSKAVLDRARAFESALARAPTHRGTVYRAMYDMPVKDFKRITTGRTWTLETLASSSRSRKVAESYIEGRFTDRNVLLVIKNQTKGTRLDLPNLEFVRGQQEVILPGGARYHILSREWKDLGRGRDRFLELILEEA